MSEQDPKYLHEDEGRDIAEEVKEVDDPAHAPATGRGGGVIDTDKHESMDEPDLHKSEQ